MTITEFGYVVGTKPKDTPLIYFTTTRQTYCRLKGLPSKLKLTWFLSPLMSS